MSGNKETLFLKTGFKALATGFPLKYCCLVSILPTKTLLNSLFSPLLSFYPMTGTQLWPKTCESLNSNGIGTQYKVWIMQLSEHLRTDLHCWNTKTTYILMAQSTFAVTSRFVKHPHFMDANLKPRAH